MVAHGRDRKAIAESISADDVVYLSVEGLEATYAGLSPRLDQRFEVGVFCGRYVTPLPLGYLERLEETRGSGKGKHGGAEFVMVGDSVSSRPAVLERSDVSLQNVVDDQL